jgi:hypothetical protein
MTGRAAEILYLNLNVRRILFHLLLCVVIFIVPSGAVLIPFVVGLLYYFFKKNDSVNVVLLSIYALCCKGETVYFIFSVCLFFLIVFSRKKIPQNIDNKLVRVSFFVFLAYLFLLYVLQMFYAPSLLSFPLFLVTFVSPFTVMFYIWQRPLAEPQLKKLLNELLYLAFGQAMVAFFLQAIPTGVMAIINRPTFGDVVAGTINSPNSLTFVMFSALLPFIVYSFKINHKFSSKTVVTTAFLSLFFGFIFILNDSKTTLAAYFVAAFFILFIYKVAFNKNLLITLLLVLGGVLVVFSNWTTIHQKYEQAIVKFDDYINGKYNAKFLYYKSALDTDTRSLFQYVIGTGPGTNGSRAGNALAYDVLYKKSNTFSLPTSIPAHSNAFTRDYLSKLYVQEYAEASAERSAVLGNPFNSFCAMFVEFGVLGLMLFYAFMLIVCIAMFKINSTLSFCALVLIISNLVISFLDQSYERPAQAHLMYVFVGLAFLPMANGARTVGKEYLTQIKT